MSVALVQNKFFNKFWLVIFAHDFNFITSYFFYFFMYVWGSCCSIFGFLCRVLQIIIGIFFFWPLHCLSVFDLRLLITPLTPSNISQNNPDTTKNLLRSLNSWILFRSLEIRKRFTIKLFRFIISYKNIFSLIHGNWMFTTKTHSNCSLS
jgi:hypothetical protein